MNTTDLKTIMGSCPNKCITSRTHTRWCIEVASKLGGVVCAYNLSQEDTPIFCTFVKIGELCFDCEESWMSFGDERPLGDNDMIFDDAYHLDQDEVNEIINRINSINF